MCIREISSNHAQVDGTSMALRTDTMNILSVSDTRFRQAFIGHRRFVVISAFLSLFLISLDRTIIGTAIPNITQDFYSLGDIGWYGSAYQLTTAASQFFFSKVYKFYDIKW